MSRYTHTRCRWASLSLCTGVLAGVEKKNNVCKSIYFMSSNKKNPTVDIVKYELKVKKLIDYARRKRSYTYVL